MKKPILSVLFLFLAGTAFADDSILTRIEKFRTLDNSLAHRADGEIAGMLAQVPVGTELSEKLEAKILEMIPEATPDGKEFFCRILRLRGTAAAVPTLERLLRGSEAPESVSHMARCALQEIPGPEADAALVRTLDIFVRTENTTITMPVFLWIDVTTLAGVIQAVGVRDITSATPEIIPLAKSKNAMVAQAAIRTLGRLGGEDAVAALKELQNTNLPVYIQAEVTDALLTAAEKEGVFVGTSLVNTAKEPTFVQWESDKPRKSLDLTKIPELQKAYHDETDAEQKAKILAELAVLAYLTPLPSETYKTLLEQNTDIASQKQILETMGQKCVSRDAMDFALEVMRTQDNIRPNAGLAAVRIANVYRHQNSAEAKEALHTVRNEVKHDDVAQRALAVLIAMDINAGAIREWSYAGPYSTEGEQGEAVHATAYGPEAGEEVVWTPLKLGWLYDRVWNLESGIAAGSRCTAYLRTYVRADEARELMFEAGVSDAMKLWVNGEKLHDAWREGDFAQRTVIVPVTLKSGWNEVIVKVTNAAGFWEFTGKFADADGLFVGGLEFRGEKP